MVGSIFLVNQKLLQKKNNQFSQTDVDRMIQVAQENILLNYKMHARTTETNKKELRFIDTYPNLLTCQKTDLKRWQSSDGHTHQDFDYSQPASNITHNKRVIRGIFKHCRSALVLY